MSLRAALLAGLTALALAGSGCGGDDDPEPARSDRAATETAGEATGRDRETEPRDRPQAPGPSSGDGEPPAATSPEDEPGGVGDEEPARSLALLTGRAGRITPRRVRVPAYIAIRVELRSADGGEYGLRFDGRVLQVEGMVSSVTTTLDGLRPGQAAVGEPISGGNSVRIEATAEPGP